MNSGKSAIFFFKNVSLETRRTLVDLLGFTESENLGKCLGILLSYSKGRSKSFGFVPEKVGGLEGELSK